MRFLATTLIMAGILIATGCRSAYNPTPPPYYCQPACGCAPGCAPTYNQCAPSTTPYLTPTPTNIPRSSTPAAGTYGPSGPSSGAMTYPPPGSNGYPPPSRQHRPIAAAALKRRTKKALRGRGQRRAQTVFPCLHTPDAKGCGTPFTCRESAVPGQDVTYYAPPITVVVDARNLRDFCHKAGLLSRSHSTIPVQRLPSPTSNFVRAADRQ